MNRPLFCLTVRQLQEISQLLAEITEENGLRRFAEAGKEASTISGFIDDIRDAILEYQVCKLFLQHWHAPYIHVLQVSLQMFMYKQNNKQIVGFMFSLVES
jgi:hypothetical protein